MRLLAGRFRKLRVLRGISPSDLLKFRRSAFQSDEVVVLMAHYRRFGRRGIDRDQRPGC